MELLVLSALVNDRRAHDKLHGAIDKYSLLSDQAATLYTEVCEFYDKDPAAQCVDIGWLVSRVERKYEKHAELFKQVIDSLQPVSVDNIIDEFIEFRKQVIGQQLAGALLTGKMKEVNELLEVYTTLDDIGDEEEAEGVYEGTSVSELFQILSPENVVPVYPKVLNERLGGGLPKGAHMFVFARPEAGKTLTAVNMACGMANAGRRVLYINNEDPIKLVMMRVVGRLTGLTRAQMKEDMEAATQLALQRGYGNIRFVSLAPGTVADVRKHILEYKPDAAILDQITNLNHKNLSKTEKFEEVTYRFRMLVKELDVAGISFGQAAESADGKLVLDMEDVYFSKTGIPAQCDVMVGVGFNNEYYNMSRRMLSLPKNKIGGDHTPFPVTIEPGISRMVGV